MNQKQELVYDCVEHKVKKIKENKDKSKVQKNFQQKSHLRGSKKLRTSLYAP
jgi:hypothetical protein